MSQKFSVPSFRLAAAAAMVALSLGVTACGDDEPTASSPAPAAPKNPSNPKLDKTIAADTAALEKKGFEPEPTAQASARGGILRVGLVTVYYFNNVADAKAAKKEFAQGEQSAGTKAKI